MTSRLWKNGAAAKEYFFPIKNSSLSHASFGKHQMPLPNTDSVIALQLVKNDLFVLCLFFIPDILDLYKNKTNVI
jgi:hypothetical protein